MRTPLAVGFSPSPVSAGAALCLPQSASDKRGHGGARTRLTSFFRPAFITRHLVPLLRAQINPGRTEGRQPVYRATDACSKGPAWNCPARRQEVPGKGREAPRVAACAEGAAASSARSPVTAVADTAGRAGRTPDAGVCCFRSGTHLLLFCAGPLGSSLGAGARRAWTAHAGPDPTQEPGPKQPESQERGRFPWPYPPCNASERSPLLEPSQARHLKVLESSFPTRGEKQLLSAPRLSNVPISNLTLFFFFPIRFYFL